MQFLYLDSQSSLRTYSGRVVETMIIIIIAAGCVISIARHLTDKGEYTALHKNKKNAVSYTHLTLPTRR